MATDTQKLMAGGMAIGMVCALYRARALDPSNDEIARMILSLSGDLERVEAERPALKSENPTHHIIGGRQMSDTALFNPCMKTGLWFAFRRGGDVQTGDLFLTEHGLQIRGVPDCTHSGDPDVIICPCALVRRPERNGRYSDTDAGHVRIIECTDHFREHVRQWAPAMLGYLP